MRRQYCIHRFRCEPWLDDLSSSSNATDDPGSVGNVAPGIGKLVLCLIFHGTHDPRCTTSAGSWNGPGK